MGFVVGIDGTAGSGKGAVTNNISNITCANIYRTQPATQRCGLRWVF